MKRQEFLALAAGSLAALATGACRQAESLPAPPPGYLPPGELPLVRFPQKAPLLFHNDRAPLLETPLRYFETDLTPNEAFFVRWHLAGIPTQVDLDTWRLRIQGRVARPLQWSLDELRALPATTLVAVNQCSGNARRFFAPRVPGGQWGNGAMGNARWTGVRLGDLLQRAGLAADAVAITCRGLDEPPLPTVPPFVKSLSRAQALHPDTLVAYAMNGAPLPFLNGFPVRLVVPGWYATYWVKSLTYIEALRQPFEGFWMTKAYRVPNNALGNERPDQPAPQTVPIGQFVVRSIFVKPAGVVPARVGQPLGLEGVAFDRGSGILRVDLSPDEGRSWQPTQLGPDLGGYSFRRWRATMTPSRPENVTWRVRATSRSGEVQPLEPNWNGGGFMYGVADRLVVAARA